MIESLLDNDKYAFTQSQLAFHQFPNVMVHWKFINRGGTEFSPEHAQKLKGVVHSMADLSLTRDESHWLKSECPELKPSYREWLQGFRFNPDEVGFYSIKSGPSPLDELDIVAPLYRGILWEVPLLAATSEIFFESTYPIMEDVCNRAYQKSLHLFLAGVFWGDAGTRRRFSSQVHEAVVNASRGFETFLGTSNVNLARKFGLKPLGTMGHLGPMVMQAIVGVRESNTAWCEAWLKEYEDFLQYSTVLPDTLTSEFFFNQTFNGKWARIFDSIRQDSGDPDKFMEMLLSHYEALGIDPKTKAVVFSDGLNDMRLIELKKKWEDRIRVRGLIGTNLTNDVGVTPLNIVIKPVGVSVDGGDTWRKVVKLSDTPGKVSGDKDAVEAAKYQIAN